jgi:outer membrane protein assembly factor BamB
MLGGDAGHSGFVAAETRGPPLTLAWSTPIAAGFAGPPVVEGGRVVVLTSSGLQAFEVANGASIWQRAVTGGWPALVDGQVYLAGGSFASAAVRQFDRGTGEPGFVAAIESQAVQFWSPIVVGSALYTNGGLYGGLYGLDVSAGGARLFFDDYGNSYGGDRWSPAFADGVLYTYLGDLLRAHDPVTGAVTASRAISPFVVGGMRTVPVLAGGRGFVVAQGNPSDALEAFAAGTLERLWRVEDAFTAYPAVAEGVVYVTAEGPFRETQLRAYDAATGALRWATEYHGNLQGPPLVAGGTAYLRGSSGTWGVDLATHAVTYLTGAHGDLAIWNGYLVVNDIGAGYGAASLKVFRLTP